MKRNQLSFSIRKFLNIMLPICVLFLPALSGRQQASNAVVTVTEFSDFQCPYCKQASRVVEQLRQSYGKRVNFVFKQMPLAMHNQAFQAAQSSVCAREQGKFWEFHDRLFEAKDLSLESLNQMALEVGLSQRDFKWCLESETSRAVVESDLAEANRLGVSGTPSFFVNGARVEGPPTLTSLSQIIEAALTNHAIPQYLPISANATAQDPPPEAAVTTVNGVTLSPAALNFGYQLTGTSSPPLTETITNSSNAAVVIKDINLNGPDQTDFVLTHSFGLPVTLAPASSVQIGVMFTATAPWKPGTRDAKIKLKIGPDDNKTVVPLSGIAATCGGPLPACKSGCADTDGDGLNDAWEISGGIDYNNDGRITAANDVLLNGSDPHRPDIYVQYDWMDYGPMETPCNGDSNCPGGLNGFRCSGPALTEGFAGSCVRTCGQDSDCTSLGNSHLHDRCGVADGIQQCLHSHDPGLLVPDGSGGSRALDEVAAAFARHNISLHIIRGQAQPHSHIVSFATLNGLSQISNSCEGASVATGNAGLGLYAESIYDLKARTVDPRRNIAYHYALFSHYSSCDSADHCAHGCPLPLNPDGSPKIVSPPRIGQSGVSEFFGNDFIVSLANFIDEVGNPPGVFNVGGTFMHELGHNLGLHHGGGFDSDGTAEDIGVEYKPNYLSVMSYQYQLVGIPHIDGPRLDYSSQALPVGTSTPGTLFENGMLDEAAGLGSGDPGSLFYFTDSNCNFQTAATDGPVDWDGDGIAGDTFTATADLHPSDHAGPCLPFAGDDIPLRGHVDWPPGAAQPRFTFAFQCASGLGADGAAWVPGPFQSGAVLQEGELTPEIAARMHALYPIKQVKIDVTPGCEEKVISPGRSGGFSVALFGANDLDVREVEPASLRFLGATSVGTELYDINGDGKLDLIVTFDPTNLKLPSQANTARLTGWLKTSQVFIGEDRVTILP